MGANDVVFIEKGKSAPFSGLLFTEEKAESLRKEVLEFDKTMVRYESVSQQLSLAETRIKLKDEQIELYRRQNQRLDRANDSSNTMQYIWFGLGVLVTGAAVYGAGALSK